MSNSAERGTDGKGIGEVLRTARKVRWLAPDASSSTAISSPPTPIIASKCRSARQGGHELEICLQSKARWPCSRLRPHITEARPSAPTPIFSTSAWATPSASPHVSLTSRPNTRTTAAVSPDEASCSWIFVNPGSSTLCRVCRVYLRVRLPIGEGSPGDFLLLSPHLKQLSTTQRQGRSFRHRSASG
jgi:hypothetical protein